MRESAVTANPREPPDRPPESLRPPLGRFWWLVRLFAPSATGALWPRWIFLRGLGTLFFSAFYSLAFQIHGLIGRAGVLPAGEYLEAVARDHAHWLGRLLAAPTLLWLGDGRGALTALVALGLVASVLLTLNLWPRLMVAACGLLFLSFVSAARAFSAYQSDGMLLEAAFLSLFFAPPGLRPGLGEDQPPSLAARFLLVWEWFRIYFESGMVKLLSGDPHWRHLTALDHYYEYGPLPTWIGYWVQHLPHGVHAATALVVLIIELVLVWTAFLPRPFRTACFLVVTPMQVVIILTANYAFLNYLVLLLGVLLLDDTWLAGFGLRAPPAPAVTAPSTWRLWSAAVPLTLVFYVTVVLCQLVPARSLPSPLLEPVRLLEPFRIANRYGLFAVMTEPRYEIELQGSRDGRTWAPYRFRYKPQALDDPPGLYAPYQPRFEWNLWFASLGSWQSDPWVVRVEQRLLEGSPDVLALFREDPFGGQPPIAVRAVLYQYSFTSLAEHRATGRYWTRDELGLYAPSLGRASDGRIIVLDRDTI